MKTLRGKPPKGAFPKGYVKIGRLPSVVSILAVIGTYIYFKKQLNSLHLIPQKK